MNKNRLVFATLAVCAAALTGCASTSFGNARLSHESQADVSHKLVRGVTTEAQVRQMFGTPQSTSFTGNGDAIWKYSYSKYHQDWEGYVPDLSMFKNDQKESGKLLTILFNPHGRVQNYSLTGGSHVDHHAVF